MGNTGDKDRNEADYPVRSDGSNPLFNDDILDSDLEPNQDLQQKGDYLEKDHEKEKKIRYSVRYTFSEI